MIAGELKMRKRQRHSGSKKPADLVRATGIARGTWMWCLQCERCYQAGEYRQVGEWQLCPYADCGGDTVVDSVLWEQRRQYHPEYPVSPERNTVYPRG
jgi:hypothetical protein